MKKKITIKDVIDYLKKNFKPEDKLCFFDEGGAYCELENIPQGMFGSMFWKYVKTKMDHELEHERDDMKKYIYEAHKDVQPDDVVIY